MGIFVLGETVKKLRAPTARPIKLRALRPNAGVEASYRKALVTLVNEMANSVQYWLSAAWNADPPHSVMAQDASPIQNLRKAMERLGKKWTKRFDEASEELTKRFADKSIRHTSVAMRDALRDAGFAVEFKMTEAMRDAFDGVVAENVGLIKSIPQQYLGQVQQEVWQAVSNGSDLATLTKNLMERHGSTARRAKLIARDQNAKAHAAIEGARRNELGIETAVWVHSGAGKHPRPEHVKAGQDKLVFNIKQGAYLDGQWTWPGYEINCRCTSQAIVPGWED